MPIRFKDREAKYPNRWTMKKSDGTSEVVILIRNDEPIVEGTPLNAETINSLSDVAGAYEARAQSEEFANSAKISEAKAANAAAAAENNKSLAAGSAKAAADSENTAKKYLEQVKTITTGAQGWYATPAALQAAVPIGENGWFAFVGTTDTIWTWDGDAGAWVDTGATSRLAEYYTRDQVDSMLAAQRLKDHPVGSPFLTITDEDPNVTIGGTWVKIAENRAIMGASETHPAGTTVEAGLPNITGWVHNAGFKPDVNESSGALYAGLYRGTVNNATLSTNQNNRGIDFDASRSNPIYGKSDTVQPPGYYFNIWIRTA